MQSTGAIQGLHLSADVIGSQADSPLGRCPYMLSWQSEIRPLWGTVKALAMQAFIPKEHSSSKALHMRTSIRRAVEKCSMAFSTRLVILQMRPSRK